MLLGCGPWLAACSSAATGEPGSGGSGGAATTGSGGNTGSGGSGSGGGPPGSGGSTVGSGGASGTGGAPATGGTTGTGGRSATGGTGTGGRGGTTGSAGTTGSGGRGGTTGSAGTSGAGGTGAHFSFFAASLAALQKLSGSANGFGGDLRYGESTGLAGADKICTTIAEMAMPGAGAKTWRAFLSTVDGPVNAKDRVGQGPWYDRKGRLIAATLSQLLMTRPADADAAIKNDLPNEDGIANQNPDGTGNVDNHDFLTGTGPTGSLYMSNKAYTCNDWTSSDSTKASNGPWVGHSWGAPSGQNWMSALRESGCGAGINLVQGAPRMGIYTVGEGGGYGGIYCLALSP